MSSLATRTIEPRGTTIARPPEPLQPGYRFGRYQLIEPLGEGGMGVVWAVTDTRLDRVVALKVLRDSRNGHDREAAERLRREASSLAAVSHPNVVPIYDVGVHEGRVFLVMEYVRGQTLRKWLSTNPGARELRRVMFSVGEGLAAVHDAGFVHRDIKPDNIMLTEDDRVLVMDFGLARLLEATPSSLTPVSDVIPTAPSGQTRLTSASIVVGTPPYMAPEMHASSDVDTRVDQYAFCVTLFQAWVGRRPFRAKTFPELLLAKRDEPPDFSEPRLPVPPEVREVIERGLAFDRRLRFDNMRSLLDALRPPSSRWRRAPYALGIVLVASTAYLGFATLDQPDCTEPAQRVEQIWNPEVAAQLRQGFGDDPVAKATAEHVIEELDTYASQLVAVGQHACRARPKLGLEHSRHQRQCLDLAQASLQLSLEQLLDADRGVVLRAREQVRGLPSVARCEAPPSASDAFTPAAPAAQVFAQHAELELERARALKAAGRYDQAHEVVEALIAPAREHTDNRLMVRLLDELGVLAMVSGDYERSTALRMEAATLAASTGQDAAAAELAIGLVFDLAEDVDRPQEAERWARHAQAALDRVPNRSALNAQYQISLGAMHGNRGNNLRACEHFRNGLAIYRAAEGDHESAIINAMANLAICLGHLRRYEDGEPLLREALAGQVASSGEHHPSVADSMGSLATNLAAQGRQAEADELYTQAIERADAALGSSNMLTEDLLRDWGFSLLRDEQWQAADDRFRKALAIVEARLGMDAVERGRLLIGRGEALMGQARFRDALAVFQQGREIVEPPLGADSRLVGTTLMAEAEALIGLADPAARARFDRSMEVLEPIDERERARVAKIRAELARLGEAPREPETAP